MVRDINPTLNFGSAPQFLAVLGSKMLLGVYADNFYGRQLYISDGTASGTTALTSIPAPAQGVKDGVFVTGAKAYFAVQDNTGNKMIVTDGTPAGTHEISNPYGGTDPAQALAEDPKSYQQLGGRVLYVSRTSVWSIDVTTDTVTSVTSAEVVGDKLIPMNGYVLFLVANYASTTTELWRSDGTGAGTLKVATIDVAPNYSLPLLFEKTGGRAVFRGNDGSGAQLYSSDGTSVTRLTNGSDVSGIGALGNILYFTMGDAPGATTLSMWRSDGTAAGTRKITAFGAIDASSVSAPPIAYGGDANIAYFEVPDVPNSRGLAAYDPAADRVTPIKGNQFNLVSYTHLVDAGRLYFSPDDFVRGSEPWISDGTIEGTHLTKDINPQIATFGARPDWLANFGGKLAFAANDGVHGQELWISDGTTAGTTLLADIAPGELDSSPVHPFVSGDALYFFAYDATRQQRTLMRLTAGTATPTTLAALTPDITPPGPFPYFSIPCQGPQSATLGDKVFFAANDGSSNLALWMSDGTSAGTHQVRDTAGVGPQQPCAFTLFKNRVFFIAVDATGSSIWATDGTAAGTARIGDVARSVFLGSGNAVLQPLGSSLYFSARTDALRLWKTDGTPANASIAVDFGSPLGLQIARGQVNGKLLLRATVGIPNVAELWVSDGTQSGSTRLATMAANPYVGLLPSDPITISGNKAYFVGEDATAGQELWVTDGTATGTRMLKDINPAGDSKPYRVVSLGGGMAVFNVVDPLRGDQLWRTDGTSAGTVLISDVSPNVLAGSQVSQQGVAQLAVGQHYFFVAEDPAAGSELFALADELPLAAADSGTSTSGAVASINVLANDTDSDGVLDSTTVKITTSPSHGTVVVGPSGVLNYTPTSGHSGADTFAYTVSDNQGGASAPATVTVTSTAAPVPPVNSGSGGKGGGGAMSLLELIALALFLCSGWRRHASGAILSRNSCLTRT